MAWVNADNIRHSKAHMGEDQIDVIFANFYLDEPLAGNGEIGPNSKAAIDAQVNVASIVPNAAWGIGPTVGNTDACYYNGAALDTGRWANLIAATRSYLNTSHGKTLVYVMPFNEPDYWAGQGTPQELHDILTRLEADPGFSGVGLMGPSTLKSDPAIWWYDQVSGPVTHGTTHQLAGSADSFASFFEHVAASGDVAHNPELHSLAEAIYSAEYGVAGGAWWAAVMRARGLFVQSCQGRAWATRRTGRPSRQPRCIARPMASCTALPVVSSDRGH